MEVVFGAGVIFRGRLPEELDGGLVLVVGVGHGGLGGGLGAKQMLHAERLVGLVGQDEASGGLTIASGPGLNQKAFKVTSLKTFLWTNLKDCTIIFKAAKNILYI